MQVESFKKQFVTVMVTPYQTARGRLVSFGPQPNSATIDVNGRLVSGECLSCGDRRANDEQPLACA